MASSVSKMAALSELVIDKHTRNYDISTLFVLARPKSYQVVQDEPEERRIHDARGTVEELRGKSTGRVISLRAAR